MKPEQKIDVPAPVPAGDGGQGGLRWRATNGGGAALEFRVFKGTPGAEQGDVPSRCPR